METQHGLSHLRSGGQENILNDNELQILEATPHLLTIGLGLEWVLPKHEQGFENTFVH